MKTIKINGLLVKMEYNEIEWSESGNNTDFEVVDNEGNCLAAFYYRYEAFVYAKNYKH